MLKLFIWGTLASTSGVLAAPRVSMSSRETLIRFEPVGGTPRILVPVTIMSSTRLSASSGSCGAGADCASADPAHNRVTATSDVPARAHCFMDLECLIMSFPPADFPLSVAAVAADDLPSSFI